MHPVEVSREGSTTPLRFAVWQQDRQRRGRATDTYFTWQRHVKLLVVVVLAGLVILVISIELLQVLRLVLFEVFDALLAAEFYFLAVVDFGDGFIGFELFIRDDAGRERIGLGLGAIGGGISRRCETSKGEQGGDSEQELGHRWVSKGTGGSGYPP